MLGAGSLVIAHFSTSSPFFTSEHVVLDTASTREKGLDGKQAFSVHGVL